MGKLFRWGFGTVAAALIASPLLLQVALGQSNPANPAPAPAQSPYGCPTQAKTPNAGAVCAGPGNVGTFNPTGDGSLAVGGHFYSRSNMVAAAIVPVIGACGTGSPAISVTSTDTAGTVTTGTGAPTTCAVVFGNPYTSPPHVFVNLEVAGATANVTTVSGTGFTVTFSAGQTSQKFDWLTVGSSD